MEKQTAKNRPADLLDRVLSGLRNRHLFVLDFLIFCAAPFAAVWLRTDGVDNLSGFVYIARFADSLALYTLVAMALRWCVFMPFGLYSRYWRYASVDELAQITLAVVTSSVLITLVFFGVLRPYGFHTFGLDQGKLPRTLPVIEGILVLLAVGGLRFSVRLFERARQRRGNYSDHPTRVAIIGAGDAGAIITKELQANSQLGLVPAVFLDDDPHKQGTWIHGVRVVGGRDLLGDVSRKYQIGQAVIAMPTASGRTIRELTRACQEAGLPVKTVPGIFELLDGSVTVNQLRPVDIADLLRREPVATDLNQVTELLRGKRVLVTGAGGSIGGELCRQIARCKPAALITLGHGEHSIFEITNELRHAFAGLPLHPVIADIRDADRLRSVFAQHRPEIVFHAAAHKHVLLMEENVEDAVTNNILGTRCLVRCAQDHGTDQFVLISSDKAVNPSSVMGTTKRVAELLVQDAARRTGRCYVAVRFGNVLGSRGSVVPLFKQQIARGGPITITHPDVRRYFMTIPEASQLVLQAAALGRGGEIFVLEMGTPVKIVDLARDLIRLSGIEEGQDIDIVFTGLGAGEKLYEELFSTTENCDRTMHEKILVVPDDARSGLPSRVQGDELQLVVSDLIKASRTGDRVEMGRLLNRLVPEFRRSGLQSGADSDSRYPPPRSLSGISFIEPPDA